MPAVSQLDKLLNTALAEGYGTITIRVVVLEKGMAPAAAPTKNPDAPADAEPDEVLPETDKRPISTFLEEPKRGKQCCVFLINGQRQHAWDNTFIVRDLDLKYLRNRMIVVVDCDGLRPEATADLMQGSRFQFCEGTVYAALEQRVVATLKGDPDLRQLEEEAEDDISSLQAGDEAVTHALDQLIEAHHDAGAHVDHGQNQAGDATRDDGATGTLIQTKPTVIDGDQTIGTAATDPVLLLRPDVATLRLKPNEIRKFLIHSRPEAAWKVLETLTVSLDPPVKEMLLSRTTEIADEEVAIKFVEPDDMDDDEYPVETMVRATAIFKGYPDVRLLERRVIVNRKKPGKEKKKLVLKDDPTFVKITSRQPIKIVLGGPDVHVKLKWDGKDELVAGTSPLWTMCASCESPSIEPPSFLTQPVEGRFELLIQASAGLTAGEQLKFDVEVVGPGKTLSTAFLADVVEPPSARRVTSKLPGGGQRRPPYQLMYVTKENWVTETNWGEQWNGDCAGAFDAPTLKNPLYIYINTDMDILTAYRDTLVRRKNAETTIQQRINKYTTHIAFHIYQMYQKQKQLETAGTPELAARDEQMREEVQRVARTMITLMDVTG